MPSALTLDEVDRRELITWAAVCVERVMPLFDAERPDDNRLRAALTGSAAFARSELTVGAARQLAFACHAAARDATDPAARATARAAGHAVAVAHMAAHARGVVRYTRSALVAAQRDPRTKLAGSGNDSPHGSTPTCTTVGTLARSAPSTSVR